MRKTYLLLFLLIILLQVGTIKGVAMGERLDIETVIKEKMKKVDISDGVSKEEAIIIAQNYMIDKGKEFYKDFKISDPKVPEDSWLKGYWLVSFSTTFKFKLESGLKWNFVHVNKKTGKVRYGGEGPS